MEVRFVFDDYQYLYDLGKELYDVKVLDTRRREIATTIIAMAESVIGVQADRPLIDKKYTKYSTYMLHSLDR